MASSCKSGVATEAVCLTCGDKGDTRLLICCINCEDSVVHKYCLDEASFGVDDCNWTCWECAPKVSKAESSRKSERISSRRDQAVEVRHNLKQLLRQKFSKTANRSIKKEHGMDEWAQMVKVSVKHEAVENAHLVVDGLLPNVKRESLNLLYEAQSNEEFRNRTRWLMFDDKNDLEVMSEPIFSHGCYGPLSASTTPPSSEHDDHQYALPLSHPIWRGYFSIEEISLGILAHLSSTACLKVYDAAAALPPVLDIAILSRSDVWPKSFKTSPPTAGSIGLYFFPENERAEKVFDDLLDDIIEHNLALKVVFGNVELLIFSSRELLLEHWRFCRKYYLWGVFRKICRSFSLISSPNPVLRAQNADAPTEMRIQGQNEVSLMKTGTTWSPDGYLCRSLDQQ